MQTIIDTLLIVIRNIPGIDEAVYSNIYDIELTDKTVFVIVPGDISENITAYLVNGSILLMSKVMLVLKSKYMETNMVITSWDNIKEFSLDNCSGVYNIIKYKRIYKREYCGDYYEGMFVKSVNGLHGEVFLDIPLKISDLPNDVGYITEDELPIITDYTDKFNEIDSSILDVSNRVFYIEADYVKQGDLPDYTVKFNEIDSSILDVSTRVHYIENDYVKHEELPILPDYTDKFNEIDSSISNVSTRVHDIENDYVKHDELPIIHDYTDKFNLVDSSIYDVSSRVHYIENDYVKHDELPDYTDKLNEIDSSISNVSTRVHNIENDYTTREYVDLKISEIVIESGVSSVNGMTGDVVIDIPSKVSDLLNDSNFISRQEAEDGYAKKGDVYTKGQIDQKFIQTAQRIVDVSTNLNNEVSRLDEIITDVSSDITTINSSLQSYNTRITDNELKNTDQDSSISRLNTSVNTLESSILTKQEILVSGTNIKTINGNDILGEGNIEIQGGGDLSNYYTKTETEGLIAVKLDILVSGTNIKTINGEDILGSGNIEIQGGGGSGYTKEEVDKLFADSSTYVNNNYTKIVGGYFENCNDTPVIFYKHKKQSLGKSEVTFKIGSDGYASGIGIFLIYQLEYDSTYSFHRYVFKNGEIYAKGRTDINSIVSDSLNNKLMKGSEVYTKSEIDTKLGDINTILESI